MSLLLHSLNMFIVDLKSHTRTLVYIVMHSSYTINAPSTVNITRKIAMFVH